MSVQRLEEIQEQIESLIGEAECIVRGTDAEARATAYWIPNMKICLGGDHGYLGGIGCSLQDTIDELREE